MTPEEFIARLNSVAEEHGVPYARLENLKRREEQYSHNVSKYKGYTSLSGAFICFFQESIECLNEKGKR